MRTTSVMATVELELLFTWVVKLVIFQQLRQLSHVLTTAQHDQISLWHENGVAMFPFTALTLHFPPMS